MAVLKANIGGVWVPVTGGGGGGIGLIPGGTTDQVLAKKSDADYDTKWATVSVPDLSGYVRKTGDTMTGLLTGTGGVTFGSPGKWSGYTGIGWGPTGDYLLMADANDTYVSTARAAGSVFLRPGQNGTNQLAIDPNGNHSLGGNLSLGPGVIAAERGDFGWSGIRMGGSKVLGWYQNGDDTWVRSVNDKGVYTGGQMQMATIQCNSTAVISGELHANGSQIICQAINMGNASKITNNGTTGGWYYDQGFLAQCAGGVTRCGYGMHPGGIAGSMSMNSNNGTIFFYNTDGGWYADIWCNTVSQASSIRGKTDVAAWPPKSAGAAVMGASNRLSLIDVVSYRIKPEHALIHATAEGEEPRLHDCDIDDCDGTSDEPCLRVIEQQNPHIGIIIEDLATVLPEAVALDAEGKPGAMRTGTMIGYLLAVCKEQQERIESQQERIEALEHHQQEAA
jgi:hypothetical protein